MHKALFFVLALAFPFSAMAYSFDDIGHYTDEQFRKDVKSYLDYQQQQQAAQQYQQTVNNILNQPAPNVGSSFDHTWTDYDIQRMQQQIDQSNQNSKKIDDQISQLNNLLTQQQATLDTSRDQTRINCQKIHDGQQAGKYYDLDADGIALCATMGIQVLTKDENLQLINDQILAEAANKNTDARPEGNPSSGEEETFSEMWRKTGGETDASSQARHPAITKLRPPHAATNTPEMASNTPQNASSSTNVLHSIWRAVSDWFGRRLGLL